MFHTWNTLATHPANMLVAAQVTLPRKGMTSYMFALQPMPSYHCLNRKRSLFWEVFLPRIYRASHHWQRSLMRTMRAIPVLEEILILTGCIEWFDEKYQRNQMKYHSILLGITLERRRSWWTTSRTRHFMVWCMPSLMNVGDVCSRHFHSGILSRQKMAPNPSVHLWYSSISFYLSNHQKQTVFAELCRGRSIDRWTTWDVGIRRCKFHVRDCMRVWLVRILLIHLSTLSGISIAVVTNS